MKATGGRVRLKSVYATKKGLPLKSPPRDRPPCTPAPLKAAPTWKSTTWTIGEHDNWGWDGSTDTDELS
eukprot:3784134-Prorocentrum_lima.AAC.1